MDLISKKNIKDLFKKHGLKPLRRFGQNFLVDKEALNKLVTAAELSSRDLVLEIGPGIGALTQELAKKAKKVIAVEKDRNMVNILNETLKGFDNVEIINGDIRISDFPNIDNRKSDILKYKVVANLPFYLTAPVIRKFLEYTESGSLYSAPEIMVLMVQKEVGQRICVRAPCLNLLAVSVQIYAEPKIVSYVSKSSFWPQPKVDAVILKISNFKSQISNLDKDLFFKIVKAGFSQPRKQIVNNLSKKLKLEKIDIVSWLLKNKIQPTQRAETLSIDDWLNLTKTFML